VTISGLLKLGAAEVIDSKTGDRVGYVYTTAHGKGQTQRWLLYQNPQNYFEIRPPPDGMATWTLEMWQSRVPGLWQPNAYYVWAQADVYEYGQTYDDVLWTRIPLVDELPKPTFLEIPGTNYQLDYLNGKLIDLRQPDARGYAYVVRGLVEESSIEYWLLPEHYQPGGSIRTTVATGNATASSLEEFVAHCQPRWLPGTAFVITGCLNYHNVDAPFAP
jgi:hypothetical protein